MGISTIMAQDAISVNEAHIPVTTLACGYDTGSGGIAWTPQQFAARTHPYPAIHIDQDRFASDYTADVLDVEPGAATQDEIVHWYLRTLANFHAATRPGQRKPIIYCSMSPLTGLVNTFKAAGISNVGFWTAQPGNTLAFAQRRITTATGPYPCVGVQYSFGSAVDYDLFNLEWVTTVSSKPKPPPVETSVIAQVTWHGNAGLTSRRGAIPLTAWNQIKWVPKSPD